MDNKVNAAFLKNDIKAFEAVTRPLVTSDFKSIQAGASMGYDEMLSQMKMSFGMFTKITRSTSTIHKVSEKGNVGTVNQTHDMLAIMSGPDKKPHKLRMTGSTVQTFRKEGKVWKLAVMNWTTTKMTMDGKPFDPSKMAPAGK